MKNLKKIVCLSLATMLCASTTAVNAQTAFADDTVDNTFAMEKGASIHISEKSGIRFRVNIGEDFVDDITAADEFGFLIFPHQYLSYEGAGTADWHVKYTNDTTAYGLDDYVEVKATGEDIATIIYQDDKDGKYYANGVLQTVQDKDLDFAAIAFYKNGDTYTYAEFDKSFSRDLKYVAQQAYISEGGQRTALKNAFDWLESSTFEITSGADMYRLSKAVAAGESFANINFQMATTVAVGSDYTAVPANFAGNWSWGNYALLVVDNEAGRGFESDSYNKQAKQTWIDKREGVAVMSSKLIDGATAKFWVDNFGYSDNHVDSVAVDASVTDATSKADYTFYTGAAAYYTLGDGNGAKSTTNYVSVSTNGWSLPHGHGTIAARGGLEMQAIKELYSSVKFRFYVSIRPNAGGRLYGASNGGLTEAMGFVTNKTPYSEGYWFEWTCSIDELIEFSAARATSVNGYGMNATDWYEGQTATAFNGAYLLSLGKIGARLGYQQNLYIGDCVFVK